MFVFFLLLVLLAGTWPTDRLTAPARRNSSARLCAKTRKGLGASFTVREAAFAFAFAFVLTNLEAAFSTNQPPLYGSFRLACLRTSLDEIQDFDYEPGFNYELEVNKK